MKNSPLGPTLQRITRRLLGISLLTAVTLPVAVVRAELPQIELRTIEGKHTPLRSYAGKVLLVANTASLCGFTPQYKDLEKLFETYRQRDFMVLGFPSNDFGEQDPGSDQDIKKFCTTKFQITFPLFTKAPVKGESQQPFFAFLTKKSAEELQGDIEWNFEKFLLDKSGVVRARFGSSVNPMSTRITSKIEELLSEKP